MDGQIVHVLQVDCATGQNTNDWRDGFAGVGECIVSGLRVIHRSQGKWTAHLWSISYNRALSKKWTEERKRAEDDNCGSHADNSTTFHCTQHANLGESPPKEKARPWACGRQEQRND